MRNHAGYQTYLARVVEGQNVVIPGVAGNKPLRFEPPEDPPFGLPKVGARVKVWANHDFTQIYYSEGQVLGDMYIEGDLEVTGRIIGAGSPGDIKASVAVSVPSGWLAFNQTVVNAATLYTDLWNVVPAAWKSGNDLVLPDLANRFLMGAATPGVAGGANSITLVEDNLPSHSHSVGAHTHTMGTHTHTLSHTHSINHDHGSANTGNQSASHTHSTSIDHNHPNHNISGGSHSHALNPPLSFHSGAYTSFWWRGSPGTHAAGFRSATGTNTSHTHSVNLPNYNVSNRTSTNQSASHTHSFNMPNYTGTSGAASTSTTSAVDPGDTNSTDLGNTGTTGSGTSVDTTPAHLTVQWLIKW